MCLLKQFENFCNVFFCESNFSTVNSPPQGLTIIRISNDPTASPQLSEQPTNEIFLRLRRMTFPFGTLVFQGYSFWRDWFKNSFSWRLNISEDHFPGVERLDISENHLWRVERLSINKAFPRCGTVDPEIEYFKNTIFPGCGDVEHVRKFWH